MVVETFKISIGLVVAGTLGVVGCTIGRIKALIVSHGFGSKLSGTASHGVAPVCARVFVLVAIRKKERNR